MDIVEYNRGAWKKESENGNKWTIPVSPETISEARSGNWDVLLTPTRFVPHQWFGNIGGKKILCLASGGGQQGPILAAAGAVVTVFDNCPEQLDKDRFVSQREKLSLSLVTGDMRDLSCFGNETFDIIFHPVSNCFVDSVGSVWKECNRVLKNAGVLLAGFCNPITYIFDLERVDKKNEMEVRYKIPYSDQEQLPSDQLRDLIDRNEPLEFGHSIEDQLGGQIESGFLIAGLYEDIAGGDFLDPYIPTFMATRAIKMKADNI